MGSLDRIIEASRALVRNDATYDLVTLIDKLRQCRQRNKLSFPIESVGKQLME